MAGFFVGESFVLQTLTVPPIPVVIIKARRL